MKNNRKKGYEGEQMAIKLLQDKGYFILEKNFYASRYGEIDIIAKDNDIVVFIEVKARSTNSFGHPLESISPAKLRKMYQAANYYIESKKPESKGFRIDAISILLTPKIQIEHVENISLD